MRQISHGFGGRIWTIAAQSHRHDVGIYWDKLCECSESRTVLVEELSLTRRDDNSCAASGKLFQPEGIYRLIFCALSASRANEFSRQVDSVLKPTHFWQLSMRYSVGTKATARLNAERPISQLEQTDVALRATSRAGSDTGREGRSADKGNGMGRLAAMFCEVLVNRLAANIFPHESD